MIGKWTTGAIATLMAAHPSPGAAATIRVPADHRTIQQAVLAASPGDTVLVAPGRYAELVQMKDGVVLRSQSGPDSTVLVSPGLGEKPREERLMECPEGIGRSTVIEGFTFDAAGLAGCGLYCDGASPTVRGNRFDGFGWGIHLRHSEALVEENVIENSCSFGILVFASSPEIYRNVIRNNRPNAISISGKRSHPVIGGSRENSNRIYANGLSIANNSRNNIDATWNDWGWDITAEMDRKGFPADITTIMDGNDQARSHRGKGVVDYRHWIRPERVAGAPSAGVFSSALVPALVALALAGGFVVLARRRARRPG